VRRPELEVNGAGDVRASLERQPRDPFAVNVDAALSELTAEFGDYAITYANAIWRATRTDGTGELLAGDSPDTLRVAMLADRRAR
jgi:hypothetical protein